MNPRMYGRVLYFVYQQSMQAENCIADDYDDLSEIDQAAWARLAKAIDYEPSDQTKVEYEQR